MCYIIVSYICSDTKICRSELTWYCNSLSCSLRCRIRTTRTMDLKNMYLLMSKVCSECTISLTHKVIAKEYCDWIWQNCILPSSVTISLLSSLSATELVVQVSSEGVVYDFVYLRVIQPCVVSGTVYSPVCLMCAFNKVKEASVIFTSQCSYNIQILGFRPQCCNAMGIWCLYIEFHCLPWEIKMKCTIFWIKFPHNGLKWVNPPAVVWCKREDWFLQFLYHYCSFVNVLSFKGFILLTYRQIHHTFICEWFVWFRIRTHAQWFS